MTTREELEISVVSTNAVLRNKVRSMSLIELLRNVHPSFRSDFSNRLYKEGKIAKWEAEEFTIMVGK
jgi:hypothetical protein